MVLMASLIFLKIMTIHQTIKARFCVFVRERVGDMIAFWAKYRGGEIWQISGGLSDNGDPLGYDKIVTTECFTNNVNTRTICS